IERNRASSNRLVPSQSASKIRRLKQRRPDLTTPGIQPAHPDGLTRVCADLESLLPKRPIQHFQAVERSLAGNPVNLRNSLLNFLVQRLPVRGTVSRVRRLHRQFTNPLQVSRHLVQSTLSSLSQRNTIVGIPLCHVQTCDLGFK